MISCIVASEMVFVLREPFILASHTYLVGSASITLHKVQCCELLRAEDASAGTWQHPVTGQESSCGRGALSQQAG